MHKHTEAIEGPSETEQPGAVTGVLPVIPTPFLDGGFDAESFSRMLDHMLPSVDGYTLLGSTGEAPSMTTEERMAICEHALAVTPVEKQVVVGVTHTCIADGVALAKHAQAHGAAAVLCAVPYYFENSRSGPLGYLRELDAALEVPLVLYDNPAATKTKLQADQVAEWASALPQLTAVKLTDHDLTKIDAWHAQGLKVLAGDDPIAFRYLEGGVDGAMIIAPLLCPEAFRMVWDHIRAGEVAAAYAVFAEEILPILHVFGIGDEIATTKAILAERGIFTSRELRVPLEAPTPERRRLLSIAAEVARRATASRLHETTGEAHA